MQPGRYQLLRTAYYKPLAKDRFLTGSRQDKHILLYCWWCWCLLRCVLFLEHLYVCESTFVFPCSASAQEKQLPPAILPAILNYRLRNGRANGILTTSPATTSVATRGAAPATSSSRARSRDALRAAVPPLLRAASSHAARVGKPPRGPGRASRAL